MNQFVEQQWSMFEGSHALRDSLLDSLSDADLGFSPGGLNMTLGALCREMAEIEQSYVQSLKTLTQSFTEMSQNTPAGVEGSIADLKAWYHRLDADMQQTISAMSDDDLQQTIERGFPVPVKMQMEIYLQALLIFFGKATIYLRAMNRPLTQKFQDWIG